MHTKIWNQRKCYPKEIILPGLHFIFSINAYLFLSYTYHIPQILVSNIPNQWTEFFPPIQSIQLPVVPHVPIFMLFFGNLFTDLCKSFLLQIKKVRQLTQREHKPWARNSTFSSYQFFFSPFQCVALLFPIWGTWQQFFHWALTIQSFLSFSLLLG